jgi:acyl-CoA synthetase (AMP-forming)/AMP-acid ligase II
MRPGWVAELLGSRAGDTRPAHTYLGTDGSRTVLSRDALLVAVRHRSAALRRAGVQPADRVVLTTEDPASRPHRVAFLGWLDAGSPATRTRP